MATVLKMVRKVRWVALAVSLGGLLSGDAFGRGPYLPQIGPVPLRFAVVSTHPAMLPPLAMSDAPPALPIHTNDLADASLNSTNMAKAAPPSPPSPPAGSVTNLAVSPEATPSSGQTVSPRSANDLLVVSPQMLSEFFKPGATETNPPDASPAPPSDVNFTPPLPSQAIYNSK